MKLHDLKPGQHFRLIGATDLLVLDHLDGMFARYWHADDPRDEHHIRLAHATALVALMEGTAA